jgi:hypothetical protein
MTLVSIASLFFASLITQTRAQSLSKYVWSMDGGSPYRLNNAVVNIPLGSAGAHVVFSQLNGEEDTESMVEELLLPSPLVTDFGTIVFVADNCTLMMYPDPSVPTPNPATPSTWRRSIPNWDVSDAIRGINEESQLAGFAIYLDIVYVLDGRNSALHAVQATKYAFNYKYTLYLNASTTGGTVKFKDGDTGIIPDPDSNILWVMTPVDPFFGSSPGLAVQVNLTTQSLTWLPIPQRLKSDGCSKNTDEGSVSIGGVSGSSSVALLSSCGLVVLDSSGNMLYDSLDLDFKFLFNLGEHSHPLYDPDTYNLYWLDYGETFGAPQHLCCTKYSDQGFVDCWEFPNQGKVTCVNLPKFEVVIENQDEIDFRWLWLAMGLQPASEDGSVGAMLFVSASATLDDETNINGLDDLTSGLFQFDTLSGLLKSQYRLQRDMFNSAPLVVSSSVDNIVQVYVSSSLGFLYCFSANSIANGPLWSSQDIAPIPQEDLPATTYSFLSVTQTGTVLVTASAGGDTWQDQKATFAIKNGLINPVVPSSNAAAAAAQRASIAAGVSIAVLLLAGIGFWRAYTVMPEVKDATDNFVDTIKSTLSGRGQVRGVERTALKGGSSTAYSPVATGASLYASYGSASSSSTSSSGVTAL